MLLTEARTATTVKLVPAVARRSDSFARRLCPANATGSILRHSGKAPCVQAPCHTTRQKELSVPRVDYWIAGSKPTVLCWLMEILHSTRHARAAPDNIMIRCD